MAGSPSGRRQVEALLVLRDGGGVAVQGGVADVGLGRLHLGHVHRVRADRRDRPLARTTTRRRILPPWSSREGRGSRGVGVHRSSREGPDWPVRPHPSWDASSSLPAAAAVFFARRCRGRAPALLGQPSCSPEPSSRHSVSLRLPPEPRLGPGQEASRGMPDAMPWPARMEGSLRTELRTIAARVGSDWATRAQIDGRRSRPSGRVGRQVRGLCRR